MFRSAHLALFMLLSLRQFDESVGTDSNSRRVEPPCTDRSAIQWIRDPNDCSQYFICHFGQPLSMPACPYGQVWGNKARNCVPENSRWNDCNVTTYSVNDKKGQSPISVTTPKTVVVTIKPMPTKPPMREVTTISDAPSYVSTSTPQTTISKSVTKKPRTPKYFVNKTKKPRVTPAPKQDDQGKTKYPTATSPYHPQSPRRYYTYPKYTKITYKPKATTEMPRSRQTKPRPTRPPMRPTKPETKPTKPVKPVKPLVKPTRPPVKPTRPPVKPTRPRVKPTKPRMKPTKPPVRPTRPPVKPTRPRGKPVRPLVKPSRPPVYRPRPPVKATRPPRKGPVVPPTTTPAPPQRTTRRTTTTTRRTTTTTTTPPTTTTTMVTTTWPRKKWVADRDMTSPYTTPVPSEWAIKPMQLRLPEGHPCRTRPGQLVAHTSRCHWYFNCTVAALENLGGHLSALEEECRYPQLFDTVTRRCREFINVRCGDRFEPVDPCEYDANQCRGANCVPCKHRYGSCRGRQNGIYPFHTERWTPTFITCYQQRNIAQDDCQPPTPIFSPVNRDCVALSDVPKTKGGLRPDCSFREDGFYPDEQGRCGIFFECQDGQFTGYDECPSGTVFDPLTLRCQQLDRSSPPCGEGQNPSCSDRHDGFHADPFGRCPYYFECRKNQFVRHLTCDFGAFDPVTEECVIPTELMPRPCGLLPNPCEGKPSGFYPDEGSNCAHYVECSRGVMISNGTCPQGTVFSSISGRCDRPENAPPPCGLAPSCEDRQDGRYAALTRGCSFYFECKRGRFAGLKQCEFQDGGFFFNEKTGKCDFPQNICPPCGYRWWGCPRSTYR